MEPVATSAPIVIPRGDPRYQDLTIRAANARFVSTPERFVLAQSTEDVVRALRDAVRAGKRLIVRSGAHCFEDFLSEESIQVVLDISPMNAVGYDAGRRAFVTEAGATLLQVYRVLFYGWGVTVPGGSCDVGAGGHIQGGGYGPWSRLLGLSVDYLDAVEVVVVDADGQVRVVTASRNPDDPHHDLWWAHTGGGGGNFGVVTRYWFRDPRVAGDEPATLLPKPPARVLSSQVTWAWPDLDRESVRRIVRNHGAWHEANSGVGSTYLDLFGGLVLLGREPGDAPTPGCHSFAMLDGTTADAQDKVDAYVAAVTDGVSARYEVMPVTESPWLALTVAYAKVQDTTGVRLKQKSGFLRRTFRDSQIDTCYDWLSRADPDRGAVSVSLQSIGGQINAVAPEATAMAHRDAIMQIIYFSTWSQPEQDGPALDWMNRFYREMYRDTGGVPVPDDVNAGCFINFPDNDLADPRWNTSGVPWHELFYRENYPRLQRIKQRYDPTGVFHHGLSVRPQADPA